MVSGVEEHLRKGKMKNRLFLKVGEDSNALTTIESLSFYIKKKVICFASCYAHRVWHKRYNVVLTHVTVLLTVS